MDEHAASAAGRSMATAGQPMVSGGFDDVLASIGVGTGLRPLDLAAQPAAIRAVASGQDDPAWAVLDAAAAWMVVGPLTSSVVESDHSVDLPPSSGRMASPAVRRAVREVLDQQDMVGTSLVVEALRRLAEAGQYLSEFEQARLFVVDEISTRAEKVVTPRVLQAVRLHPRIAADLDKANGIEKPTTRRRRKAPRSGLPSRPIDERDHVRELRADDPARARERVRELIDAFPADWSAGMLLGVLREHLSMDDEPLLEDLLQHTENARLRSEANRLLRELPESRMMQRIAVMGEGLVHHQPASLLRRARTTYTRPETTEQVVHDLDLDDTTTSFESQIPAAIITTLPLEFWRRQLDAPLDEVILAGVSKPGATPHHVHAWIEVIARGGDADLARVVLPWATPDEAGQLIGALPPAERAEVGRVWLRGRGTDVLALLPGLDDLSDVLATELVAQLPAWLDAGQVQQVLKAVDHLRRAAPLDLLPTLADQVGALAAALPASDLEHAASLYERVRWMRWRHDLGVAVRESLQDAESTS